MEKEMVVKIADSILSSFGLGTELNYKAVKSGKTCLKRYAGKWGLPDPFVASFVDDDLLMQLSDELAISPDYTKLEKMAIIVINDALRGMNIDTSSDNVAFVFASAKGNVHLLENPDVSDEELYLSSTARKIARWFNNGRSPIVISNACISGLHAQIEVWRILNAGKADTAIVVAADILSPFVISGFQSLKALSDEPCRPFDEDRLGLNLGEASACMILQKRNANDDVSGSWSIASGAIHNDAFHISHPSRTAEGCYLALKEVLEGCPKGDISMVNVHGTATMFNDEMEAVALDRAGLSEVPSNTLKGYFGHTMGAAGLLETIITMAAMDDNTVLGTMGFHNPGVSRNVKISSSNISISGNKFIKLVSGFGGCNAAVRFEKI